MLRRDFLTLLASLPTAAVTLPGTLTAKEAKEALAALKASPQVKVFEPLGPTTTVIHIQGEAFTSAQIRELMEEINRCVRGNAHVVLLD